MKTYKTNELVVDTTCNYTFTEGIRKVNNNECLGIKPSSFMDGYIAKDEDSNCSLIFVNGEGNTYKVVIDTLLHNNYYLVNIKPIVDIITIDNVYTKYCKYSDRVNDKVAGLYFSTLVEYCKQRGMLEPCGDFDLGNIIRFLDKYLPTPDCK